MHKHKRKGTPGPRVIGGDWTIDPVSAGGIVLRYWSGRDGSASSTWMKLADQHDGSVTSCGRR